MVTSRKWMVRVCLALMSGITATAFAAEPPSPARTAALIHQLHGEQYAARDEALFELVEAGPSALEALLHAAGSADPELAWRASEAVQIVCRSVSTEAPAIHKELARLAKVTDKPVAALANKHLQRWAIYRHDFAVAELASLGARVGEVDPQIAGEAIVTAGPVLFGAFAPIDMMPAIAGGPIIAEEEALIVVDEPAPPPKKIPLFGGLFKALGKVAGGIHTADEARVDAIAEVIEAKMGAELKRLEGIEAPKDVEVVEEPPAGGAEIEEEALIEDVEAIADVAIPLVPGGIALVEEVGFDVAGGEEVVSIGPSVDPGSILFDKSWRGFDDGLRYLPDLRNVRTVTFSQATVTDHALNHVASMKSLIQLEVRGTKISGAGLQKLKQIRPHLEIVAIGPAVLGVTGSDHGQGVQVQGVMSETGARRAGLDVGDIIHKVDNLPVRGFNDLTLALYDKQPGETVTVGYSRHGKKLTAKVVLTPRSSAVPTATPAIYDMEPGFRVMPAMGFPLRGGLMIEAD